MPATRVQADPHAGLIHQRKQVAEGALAWLLRKPLMQFRPATASSPWRIVQVCTGKKPGPLRAHLESVTAHAASGAEPEWRREWAGNMFLQAEFGGNERGWLAYKKAEAGGRIRYTPVKDLTIEEDSNRQWQAISRRAGGRHAEVYMTLGEWEKCLHDWLRDGESRVVATYAGRTFADQVKWTAEYEDLISALRQLQVVGLVGLVEDISLLCEALDEGDVGKALLAVGRIRGGASTAGAGAVENNARSQRRGAWLAEAMLLVQDHPEWSNRRIAQEVGKDPATLSRDKLYQEAAKLARSPQSMPPKGYIISNPDKRQANDIEAITPSRPSDSNPGSPIADSKYIRAYCRECREAIRIPPDADSSQAICDSCHES